MIGNYNGGGIKAGVVKVFISEANRTLLKLGSCQRLCHW